VKSTDLNFRFNVIAHEIPPVLQPGFKVKSRGSQKRMVRLPCSKDSDSPIFASRGGGHIRTNFQGEEISAPGSFL